MQRIKKDDLVQVMAGSDKGKQGRIIAISLKKDKVKIEGVAVKTRHVKARRQGETSSIKKEEAFINLSSVMPICPVTKKPCRTRSKLLESGKRVRISVHSDQAF